MKWLRGLIEWWFGRKSVAPPPVVAPRPKKKQKPKQKRCIETDKICRTEKSAKEKATNSTLPKLRAYLCMFCNTWHLSHQKRKKW